MRSNFEEMFIFGETRIMLRLVVSYIDKAVVEVEAKQRSTHPALFPHSIKNYFLDYWQCLGASLVVKCWWKLAVGEASHRKSEHDHKWEDNGWGRRSHCCVWRDWSPQDHSIWWWLAWLELGLWGHVYIVACGEKKPSQVAISLGKLVLLDKYLS